MKRVLILLLLGEVFAFATRLAACDLCPGGAGTIPLSAQVAAHKMVVFGPIIKANFRADLTSGTSELRVDVAIKTPPEFKDRKTITLNRPAPPDPKIKYLVFVDVADGELDP